jgi:hypothetical protein
VQILTLCWLTAHSAVQCCEDAVPCDGRGLGNLGVPMTPKPSMRRTLMLSSSMGFDRSDTSICRFSAYEDAALTRPSSSAPLKFFVSAA